MNYAALMSIVATAALLAPGRAVAQVKHYPLESPADLVLHNVTAEAVTLDGKRGLRLTLSQAVRRQLEGTTQQQRRQRPIQQLAIIQGLQARLGQPL
jgi:hypothetical protein